MASALMAAMIGLSSVGHAIETLGPDDAARLGLEQAWRAQVSVPAGAQSIVDQRLFVHTESPRKIVEVFVAATADGKPENVISRIPHDLVDQRGEQIGKDEAERRARQEIRVLKARGITAEQREVEDFRIRLYSLADDGTIESRDAESGQLMWRKRVGNSRLVFGKIGVSENFLSVVNGSNVIEIDAANGEVMATDRTSSVPLFGCVIAGDYAVTPGANGRIEIFNISDPTEYPIREYASGAALAMPVKSPDSTKVAWGTDRGFVYVMEFSGTPSAQFRLNTDGVVNGQIAAASGDRFFFGSDAGMVYAVRATRSGEVLWNRPFGEPFYDRPVVIGEQLLIRSAYGNLMSLSTIDGLPDWDHTVANVDQIVTLFGEFAFVTKQAGGMVVINIKDGATVQDLSNMHLPRLLPNTLTNRLYLVDSGGAVQCLRPIDSPLPALNLAPDLKPKSTADESSTKTEDKSDTKSGVFGPAGGDDGIFGGGDADSVFGGGAEMDNPFGNGGGDDNPFGF